MQLFETPISDHEKILIDIKTKQKHINRKIFIEKKIIDYDKFKNNVDVRDQLKQKFFELKNETNKPIKKNKEKSYQ